MEGEEIEYVIAESLKIREEQSLEAAIASLEPCEKKARNNSNVGGSSKILEQIINLCDLSNDIGKLQEQLSLLSKKRGQSKQAITCMFQRAIAALDKQANIDTRIELIETLRNVGAGKIYIEVEVARLSYMLSKIREQEGDISGACKILDDLKVETCGSMKRSERIDILLEQMRLCIILNDFTRANMVSSNINIKWLEEEDNSKQKYAYYDMMIRISMEEKDYMQCSKHSLNISRISGVLTENLQVENLKNTVLFLIMSPYDNEKINLIHVLLRNEKVVSIPLYRDILNCFVTNNIIGVEEIDRIYHVVLSHTDIFPPNEDRSRDRWVELRGIIAEHNIIVLSKYYTKISIDRLSSLIDRDAKYTEETTCKLVIEGTIRARINRPERIVNFVPVRDPEEVLDEWLSDFNGIMNLIVKVDHLITKEKMVNHIQN